MSLGAAVVGAGAGLDMRWWGWGDPAHPPSLSAHALAFLRERIGVGGRLRPPVALASVRLDPPALPAEERTQLARIVGSEYVRDDRLARVVHAAGKGYPDLVRLRAGEPLGAPDAVVYPGDGAQLAHLLSACAERSIAVVPFGGGTSVVGGVEPLRGAQHGVIALDMRRLDALLDVDERSRTVIAQAGLRVSALERLLAPRGLTLGHFPQSFQYVSLGGCAATRSAGQASTGYGRFEEMVQGLRLCAPAGPLELSAMPASAAGPNLRESIVGSEGVLGVIERLTLFVRPLPVQRTYEGVFFSSFDAGMEALRALAQHGAAPDVARLSDRAETEVALALAGGGLKAALGGAYLRARGYRNGCLAILGFEGEADRARLRRRRAHRIVHAHGGLPVGRSPGRAWLASRFSGPYLRDELLTHGVMVETLETATSWSRLADLHKAVERAIRGALEEYRTPGIVICHISHVYETGASLYFTLLAPQAHGRELEQWRAVKDAAGRAIFEAGGTITHHHAIGRDHAGWLQREIGRQGVAMLRALKNQLDPAGIMNPGKLLPQ